MWTEGYITNTTQKVAIAYSAAIKRHVLLFYEGTPAPRRGVIKGEREASVVQKLANAVTPRDLSEAAMLCGSLFDGTQTCTDWYSTVLHGDDSDPAFFGRIEDFSTPSSTQLAREFYDETKPTRAQIRQAELAIKKYPIERAVSDSLTYLGLDAPTIRAEPLADWVAFASMLKQCMRARALCNDLEENAPTNSLPVEARAIAVMPAPSLYGQLLSSYASEINCSDTDVSGLVVADREQGRYVVGRSWELGGFLGKGDDGAFPVDKIINLHMRGVHIELRGDKLENVSTSKASLLFAEAASEITRGHVGVCERVGCGRVFVAKRSDTRFCSTTCKTQDSKQRKQADAR